MCVYVEERPRGNAMYAMLVGIRERRYRKLENAFATSHRPAVALGWSHCEIHGVSPYRRSCDGSLPTGESEQHLHSGWTLATGVHP